MGSFFETCHPLLEYLDSEYKNCSPSKQAVANLLRAHIELCQSKKEMEKIDFTDFTEEECNKLMSLYAYCVKLSNNNNYLENTFTMNSFSDTYDSINELFKLRAVKNELDL